jgi:hypothetical protein
MSESLQRFPCGEFRPGQEPRPGNGVSNSVPPVYKPEPVIIIDPFDPDRGGGGGGGGGGPRGPNPGDGSATEYNKCSKQILYCPPPLQDKTKTISRALSTCRPSFIDLVTASTLYLDRRIGKLRFPNSYDKAADDLCLGVPALDSFWAGCISESFQCIVSVTGGPTTPRYYKCETSYVQCPPSARGGTAKLKLIKREKKPCNSLQAQSDLPRSGLIPQGGSYNTGADNLCIQETQNNVNFWNGCVTQVFNNCITPDILPPPTTPRYYMCQTIPELCPPPPPSPGTTATPVKQEVRSITRRKVSCNSVSAAADQTRSSAVNQTGGYTVAADDMCIAETAANVNFWDGCTGTVVIRSCTEPTNYNSVSLPQEPQPNSTNSIRVVLASLDNSSQRIGGGTTQSRSGSIDNSQLVTQSIINVTPKKQEKVFDVNNPEFGFYTSPHTYRTGEAQGLFSTTYNFFKVQPDQTTVLVDNIKYTNIFRDRVSREVKYFLDRESSILPWHEQPFADLTNDKILMSLRPELITAFNNIHTIGQTRVNLDYFIDTLKSHIYGGTLSEFDSNYYLFIYNSQINDEIISITPLGETREAIQAGLATYENKSVSPDHTQYVDPLTKDNYKRMRVLLEDIGANIPVKYIDGQDSTMYLNNAGISTSTIELSSTFTNIGDGAGYYFSALLADDNQNYPLQSVNEISSAKYLEPIYNYQILRLLNSNISIDLTVSSSSLYHEFSSNYDVSSETPIMYFALNFETIGDVLNPNSVINLLSATYRRLSDEEAVNHSRNYSFNIIKVDLDFRDPMVQYARDTSTISVSQNDFNLRAFDLNRTLVNNRIILRNIPAAVIVTPGAGSVHNPYNARSRLGTYEGDRVVRTIKLSPSFDVNNAVLSKPPLEVSNVFNSLGTPYFGVYERTFEQDYHSNIFTYSPSSPVFDRSYYYNGSYSRERPSYASIEDPIESKMVDLVTKLATLPNVSSLTWWDVYTRMTTTDIGKLRCVDNSSFQNKLSNGWINNVKIKNVLARQNAEYTGIPDGTTIPNDSIIITENDRTYVPYP